MLKIFGRCGSLVFSWRLLTSALRSPGVMSLLALGAGGVATGAAVTAPPSGSPDNSLCPPTVQAVALATAESSFGEALFSKLAALQPRKTVLFSPMSVSLALTMLGEGAQGVTRAEFESGLLFKSGNLDLASAALHQIDLRNALKPRAGVSMAIANAIWTAKNLSLRPAYAELVANSFDSSVQSADFSTPLSAASINAWVSSNTRGKISHLVDSLPPSSRVVLVNALYFKGVWYTPFNPKLTRPIRFAPPAGSPIEVQGMKRNGEMHYLETPTYQAIALPFADPRFELVVVLPKKDSERAVAALLAKGWLELIDTVRFDNTSVSLTLPRMTLSWNGDLVPALRSGGFANGFGPSANYGGLSSEAVTIGEVAHSVRVEVDEQGAEGAAATAIVAVRSAQIESTHEMIVDHPFYLVVREKLTGTVLFMGYVTDPGSSNH